MSTSIISSVGTLVNDGLEALNEIGLQDKTLILLMGSSGVGKSTALNYLYGCEMIRVEDLETATYTIESNNPVSGIGAGVFSKTLNPVVTDIPERDFSLVDCPGFSDTRGADYVLAGSILTREVIRKAKSVKGFAIIIDHYSVMLDQRFIKLSETARNLFESLPGYAEFSDNFIFMITKAQEDISIAEVQRRLETVKKQLTDTASESTEHLLYLLEVMLKNPDNIVFCNPLNTQERLPLLDKFSALGGIGVPSTGLGLNSDCKTQIMQAADEQKKTINDLLLHFVGDSVKDLCAKIKLSGTVDEYSALKAEATAMKMAADVMSDTESIKRFLFTSNSPLVRKKEELYKHLTTLNVIFEYGHVSPVINRAQIDLFLHMLSCPEEEASEHIARIAYEDDCAIFYRADFRKAFLNVHDFDTFDELMAYISNTELASALTDIKNQNGFLYLKNLIFNCVTNAVILAESPLGNRETMKFVSTFPYVLLSEVKKNILIRISQSTNQIIVDIYDTLIVDTDLEFADFSGINLIFTGKTLELEDEPHTIDVSGKNGENHTSPAVGFDPATLKGNPGQVGNNATCPGDVIISFSKTVRGSGTLTIRADGANGGIGQKGGAGGKGADGAVGTDAGDPKTGGTRFIVADEVEQTISVGGVGGSTHTSYDYEAFYTEGTAGSNGSRGGNGGTGGNGGLGSKGGKVFCIGELNGIEIDATDGSHGLPGSGGEKGQKGAGGRGGRRGLRIEDHRKIFRFYSKGYCFDGTSYVDDGSMLLEQLEKTVGGTKIRDLMGSEYSASGQEASETASNGISGIAREEALSIKSNGLSDLDFIAEMFDTYLFVKNDFETLYDKGIIAAIAKNPDYFYAVMNLIEAKERDFFGEESESQFMERALLAYETLESLIIKNDRFGQTDWNLLEFALCQKMSYYRQRIDGALSGNRVIDMFSMCEYVRDIIADISDVKKTQEQKRIFTDFNDSIDSKINSALKNLELLRQKIKQEEETANDTIESLLTDITDRKNYLEDQKEKYEAKQESLKGEMLTKIALRAVTGFLDICAAGLGVSQVFSTLGNTAQSLSIGKASTTQSILEITSKINVLDLEMTQKNIPKVELGNDLAQDRIKVLEDLNAEKIGIQDNGGNVDKVIQNKISELKGEQPAHNLDSIDGVDEIKDAIQKKELEILRDNYTLSNDKKKSEMLTNAIQQQEKQSALIKRGKAVAAANTILGVANTTAKCVADCVYMYRDYQGKIETIGETIAEIDKEIKKMEELTESVKTFKEETLNNHLANFTSSLGTVVRQKDQFELIGMILDIKKFMGEMIESISAIGMNQSTKLAGILAAIKEIAEAQIEIADRLNLQKERRELGELIYGVASAQAITWSDAQATLIERLKINRLQYLCQLQLNAFALWAFPFGLRASEGVSGSISSNKITLSNDEQSALQSAKIQNDAIRDFINQSKNWQPKDSVYSIGTFTGSLIPNEVGGTYAAVLLDTPQIKRLLTGDVVSLALRPDTRYNAVKYVSIYANIPAVSNMIQHSNANSDLGIRMRFHGDGYYALAHNNETLTYSFPQDEIEITHSVRLYATQENSPNAIWASDEDLGLLKFKKDGIHTGRSPYSNVELSLTSNNFQTRVLSFSKNLLPPEFQEAFPGNISVVSKQITDTLKELGWINSENVITIKWSEIEASEEELGQYYSIYRAALIQELLYNNLALNLDVKLDEPMLVEFVGYRILVKAADFYKKFFSVDPVYGKNLLSQ